MAVTSAITIIHEITPPPRDILPEDYPVTLNQLGVTKVIENDTIWKLGYGFLFELHSDSDAVLYRLRDIASWSKIAKFYTSSVFIAPQGVTPSEFGKDARYARS